MRSFFYLALMLLALGLTSHPGTAAPLPPRRLPPGGQLAAGTNHTLLLRADGTLYAAGYNGLSQLGTGTNTDSPVLLAVSQGARPAGVRVVQVAAGYAHSLALGSNGLVYAWGQNDYGQLGDGTTTPRNIPVAVSLPAGVRIVQVAAGSSHSLALAADGTAYTWGINNRGQLGNNTTTNSSVPVAVAQGALPAGTRLVQVAAGYQHNLALAADGTAYAWGFNSDGQLGDNSITNSNVPVAVAPGALPSGTRLVQVTAGQYHSLALAADGTAYAWGYNAQGQLGTGTTTASRVPVAVSQGALPTGSQLVQLVAGSSHSVALTADGLAYAWGSNTFGQVGIGTGGSSAPPVTTPRAVLPGTMPSGTRLTQLAAGGQADHCLALTADGALYTWGFDPTRPTISYNSTPVLVTQPGRVSGYQQAVAGGDHSLGLHADGSLYAWGNNASGQLGTGTTAASLVPVAVGRGALPAASRWAQATAGNGYSVALTAEGLAYAWGSNASGQLGDGSTTGRLAPVAITQGALPVGTRLVQVAAGTQHALALAVDGTAYAWGANGQGQLGNAATTNSPTPVAVTLPAGVRLVQVAAGTDHSLALAADGTVYAWGNNGSGQLGDGTTTSHATPAVIGQGALPVGTRLVQVAAGAGYSLALAADGTVYAWGDNAYGKLGDGTIITPRLVPVAVVPGSRPAGQLASQVVAGFGHSLLLAADGTIYGWGSGQYGQLGNNAFATSYPAPVAEASGLVLWRGLASSASANHSLVLGEGSAVYTAGQNTFGQLGDNTTTNSPVFIRNRAALPVQATRLAAVLSLYPNPAPGGAATLTGAPAGAVVQVLDALGRVAATATTDATGTAALSGLAPGLYLVRAGAASVRLAVE